MRELSKRQIENFIAVTTCIYTRKKSRFTRATESYLIDGGEGARGRSGRVVKKKVMSLHTDLQTYKMNVFIIEFRRLNPTL